MRIQSPRPDARGCTKWRNQKTALTDLRRDLRHTLPRGDEFLPRFLVTSYGTENRQLSESLQIGNAIVKIWQVVTSKTQIMEGGLDPMHGKSKALGGALRVLWELCISDGSRGRRKSATATA